MNNPEIKVCRLCFSLITTEKFDPLEGCLITMLGIITPDLKFEITDDPVMCKECSNIVQKAFDFKTNFFEVEEMIETKKEKCGITNPNLSELMRGKQSRSSKLINYCRTCLVKIEAKFYIDVQGGAEKQEETLMLENCLFEMDSSLTTDCKICLTCFDKLREISTFKTKCMKNEEKIKTYLQEHSIDYKTKLNLHNFVSVAVKEEKGEEVLKIESSCNPVPKIEKDKSDNENSTSTKAQNVKRKKAILKEGPYKKDRKGNKIYTCPVDKCCKFSTVHKYNVSRHAKQVHHIDEEKKIFECTECDFTSTTNNIETIKHLLSHANTEAYTCTRCPYTHIYKSELIRHMFSHLDNRSIEEYRALDQELKKERK